MPNNNIQAGIKLNSYANRTLIIPIKSFSTHVQLVPSWNPRNVPNFDSQYLLEIRPWRNLRNITDVIILIHPNYSHVRHESLAILSMEQTKHRSPTDFSERDTSYSVDERTSYPRSGGATIEPRRGRSPESRDVRSIEKRTKMRRARAQGPVLIRAPESASGSKSNGFPWTCLWRTGPRRFLSTIIRKRDHPRSTHLGCEGHIFPLFLFRFFCLMPFEQAAFVDCGNLSNGRGKYRVEIEEKIVSIALLGIGFAGSRRRNGISWQSGGSELPVSRDSRVIDRLVWRVGGRKLDCAAGRIQTKIGDQIGFEIFRNIAVRCESVTLILDS